jgi:hypothetical protein
MNGKPEDELKKIADEMTWYEPEDPTPRHQCPCCDYVTLPERNNYLICPVCFWEDEGQDVDKPDETSGANSGLTVRQARENFRKLGACEPEMVKNVCSQEERKAFRNLPRQLDK